MLWTAIKDWISLASTIYEERPPSDGTVLSLEAKWAHGHGRLSRANTHTMSSSIFTNGRTSDGRFPLHEEIHFWRPQRDRLDVLSFTVIKRAGPLVIDTKIDPTLVGDNYAEFCSLS